LEDEDSFNSLTPGLYEEFHYALRSTVRTSYRHKGTGTSTLFQSTHPHPPTTVIANTHIATFFV